MNNYIKVNFAVTPAEEAATDVLAALLADVGFESFVPEETGMTAYAPKATFDQKSRSFRVINQINVVGTRFYNSVVIGLQGSKRRLDIFG